MKFYGKELINWDGIAQLPEPVKKEKILEALDAAFKWVTKQSVSGVKIAGADPNLIGQAPVIAKFTDSIKQPDKGYEVLFKELDLRNSSSPTFEIMNVNGGVTFHEHLPGEKAKLSTLPKLTKGSVGRIRFTGGFAILDDWIRYNEYYKIDELSEDTVIKWYEDKADFHYALVEALDSSINFAFDTDIVTTINRACADIQIKMRAKGRAIGENPSFTILVNTTRKDLILKALAASFLIPNSNNNEIVHNISSVITTTKVSADNYYICLPEGQNRRGEWEDLNLRPAQRDELKLGADHVWTGSYNSVIADKDQFRRCSWS